MIIGKNPLSWDGYALSFETKETKRSLYLVAPDSSGLLYQAAPSSKIWGFLRGNRSYCISKNTSNVASLVCAVRDYVARFVKTTLGSSLTSVLVNLSLYSVAVVLLGPEAIVACVIGRMIGKGLVKIFEIESLSSLYPLSAAVAGVAIGALTLLPAALSINPIVNYVSLLLERCGADMSTPQDVAELIKSPGIKGVLWSTYACIGAPLLEERLFRSVLRDYFVLREKRDEPGLWDRFKQRVKVFGRAEEISSKRLTWERMKTVIKTSVIFGIAHGSPSQGWSNIPIILSCTLFGVILALLRELTQNLWAPTTLHAVWNTLAVLSCRGIIPPIPWME